MRQLAWVLGLGIIGLLLFGSLGGTIGSALGYAIGSMTPHQKPSQPSSAQKDEGGLDILLALRVLILICLIVGGFILVLDFVWDDDAVDATPVPAFVAKKLRPEIIPSERVWSTPSCLQQNFAQRIASGIPIPPEVIYFCAYPWKAEVLESLVKTLEKHGVTSITILEQLKSPPADITKKIKEIERILDMRMPRSVHHAYEVYQVLPFVWGAQPSKSDHLKILNGYFKEDFVKKLMDAFTDIEWSAQVTKSGLIREHDFYVEGEWVYLFTSETVAVTTSEMVEVILGLSSSQTMQSRIKQLFPGSDNIFQIIWSDLESQGLHAKHMGPLFLIEAYIFKLRSEAKKVRAENKGIKDFLPTDREEQRQGTPLEIYWLREAPVVWCGGTDVTEAGQYCEGEDRVYSRVAAKAAAGPGAVNIMLRGGAVLLHELAHAYYNPQQSDDYPFVVEGLVSAYGERAMRAMFAAGAYVQSVNADAFKLLYYNNEEAGIVVQLGSDTPAKELDIVALSKKYITITKYTPYAEKAMCTLISSPIDVKVVKAFLSMSSETFRSQAVDHLRLAYAYGWGIFNFGLDAVGVGGSISQEQLDASVVQRVAISMRKNQKLDAELDTKLGELTANVNELVGREVAAGSVKCQKK